MKTLLNKACIIDLNIKDKNEAIHQMVDVLENEGYLISKESYLKDVLEREAIFATFIGHHIGLPHGRSDGVDSTGLCIARLKNEICWSNNEDEKVKTIIMIAVNNDNENNVHLQILAKLSRMLMHEQFRNLIQHGDKASVLELINTTIII